MSGPWEQYAVKPQAPVGPWQQYAAASDPNAPLAEQSSEKPTSPRDLSLTEVGEGAVKNLLPSAASTAVGMVEPLIHPVETAKNIFHTAIGYSQLAEDSGFIGTRGPKGKNGMPGVPSFFDAVTDAVSSLAPHDEKYARALNQYFYNRYGTISGFKRAVATDPVGVAADISMVATFGGDALARAPGIIGKVGEAVSSAGHAINPVAAAGKAAKASAPLAADVIGNLGTHTGAQSLKLAAEAGKKGGAAQKAFLDHMRGNAPIDDIVASARKALYSMREERATAYNAGMAKVSGDRTVLSFDDIDKHMAKSADIKRYGGIDLSPQTADTRQKITNAVDEWKKHWPEGYHTPSGFDALKQQIGDIRDHTQYGTPERLIADQAYHAVKDTITRQAPVYGKTMKDYEDASAQLEEIQKTLSLPMDKRRGTIDTAARKLLSILRNNVNTNFGRRAELGKVLEQHGAPNLPYMLAGETLSPHFPVGVGRLEAGLPGLMAWSMHDPSILAAYPFMSPRLMGETTVHLGEAAETGHGALASKSLLASHGLGLLGSDQQQQ